MRALAIMISIGAALPAFAQPDAYLGARCSPQEVIYIEADGIGFNDHTICDWVDGPAVKTYSMQGMIACRNVYVLDMSTDPVTTQEEDLGTSHIRAVLINDIDMDVYLDSVLAGRFGACG
jgi:hypothetical protein